MAYPFLFQNRGAKHRYDMPLWSRHQLLGIALELSGKPFVHDGDSLYIAKIPVRLFGIDACELTQAAITIDGQRFDYGQAAKQHLKQLTGDWIVCRLGKKDQYQRFLGTCFNGAKSTNKGDFLIALNNHDEVMVFYQPNLQSCCFDEMLLWLHDF